VGIVVEDIAKVDDEEELWGEYKDTWTMDEFHCHHDSSRQVINDIICALLRT
jgi:hypothetical protein